MDSPLNHLDPAMIENVDIAKGLYGKSGKAGYMVSGAWQTGNDYTSGDGTNIPGDYLSQEIRGKTSYATTENSRLTASLGYQTRKILIIPAGCSMLIILTF